MSRVIIRPLRQSDAPTLIQLGNDFAGELTSLGDQCINSLTQKKFRTDGFGPKRFFRGLGAISDGQLIGYILFHSSYRVEEGRRLLKIIDLYITPTYRRNNVGQELIQAVKKHAHAHKIQELEWTVSRYNQGAVDFYKALGARLIEEEQVMCLKV